VPWPAPPAPQPDPAVLLVDFDQVKLFVGWKTTDTANDALLAQAINSVCSLIADYTDRQLVKEASATTRRFILDQDDVDERSVMIDDLSATPTQIQIKLRDGTLVETCDPTLVEEVKSHRWRAGWPIEELLFNGGFATSAQLRAGYAVDITGVWGWPAIPDEAVYWTLQTIADWSTKDISRFARTFRLDTGRVEIPRVLPDTAKAGLDFLRHRSV
jgi:hypothetical protein